MCVSKFDHLIVSNLDAKSNLDTTQVAVMHGAVDSTEGSVKFTTINVNAMNETLPLCLQCFNTVLN